MVRTTSPEGKASSPRRLSVSAPTETEPTRLTTPYPTATTTRATTLASIAHSRRGTARKVAVIVWWRYSDPIWITPIVSISR